MFKRIVGLTEQELGNLLCVLLVVTGVTLGIASILPIPRIDADKARGLAANYFTNGISLVFGINSGKRANSRAKQQVDNGKL